MRLSNADVIVVQTHTMRALVNERFRRDAVVAPFMPNTRLVESGPAANRDPSNAIFLYVASGEPHKNHQRLLQAWRTLGEGGVRPGLWLTLDPARYGALVDEIEHVASVHGLQISNFGSVSRSQLEALYSKATALIYPSTLESYGLPLLEARAAGLPLITGELDYVRDIVDPEETFDPHSPLSIARAVKRFMGRPEQRLTGASAQEFLQRLLADDDGR
jgi:glycosyltransferase involved in cell wall biosynthesis